MKKLITPENDAEANVIKSVSLRHFHTALPPMILRAAFGWNAFQDLGPGPRPGTAYARSSFFMDSNSSRSISPLAKRSLSMSIAH